MRMWIVLGRKRLLAGALAALLLTALALLRQQGAEMVFVPKQPAGPVVVIDAGHGGVDGGAVARDGTAESGINLAVALRLRELFLFCGEAPLMTRETEDSLHSGDAVTIREKKVSDLKNRAALVNAQPRAVLISIHQNSLPEAPSVRGAQVFYNAVPGAEGYALSVQAALNGAVNGEKPKAARPIPSTIYLMQHVTAPAILVECGFLSNAEEAAALKTAAHQLKLALAVLCGYYHTEEVST